MTATGAASSVVEVAAANATETSDPGRRLRCLTPDNMTTRPAGAFFQALNEDAPWSISLHYCKRLTLSKTPRTILGLWRSVPSSISTGTPQLCLEEIIVKIAHLFLSKAALLAVSRAPFAHSQSTTSRSALRLLAQQAGTGHAYPHRGGKTLCRQDGATDALANVWLGRECRMSVALRSGPVRLHAILPPIFLRMES